MESFMTINSIEQIKIDIITKVIQNKISRALACKALDVTERTLRRYLRAFEERGALFVKHGNWKAAPSNKIALTEKNRIIEICRDKYYDFNRTHAYEKLKDHHGLLVSYATFNRWCAESKILEKKANTTRRSISRQRRERMKSKGIMVQMDGSLHKWFGLQKTCLIIAIDDADGEIIAGYFTPSETSFGCMSVIKTVLLNRGLFSILYVDKAGIFGGNTGSRVPLKRSGFSQLKHRLELIGIQTIYAHSAQAKGRVERAFETLQDRLISEMRLRNIFTIEDANFFFNSIFLPEMFNNKFVVPPVIKESSFRSLPLNFKAEEHFYMKTTRVVNNDHTLNFRGRRLDIIPIHISLAKKKIEIRDYPNGSTRYFHNDQEIFLKESFLKAA
jgi:transposase